MYSQFKKDFIENKIFNNGSNIRIIVFDYLKIIENIPKNKRNEKYNELNENEKKDIVLKYFDNLALIAKRNVKAIKIIQSFNRYIEKQLYYNSEEYKHKMKQQKERYNIITLKWYHTHKDKNKVRRIGKKTKYILSLLEK